MRTTMLAHLTIALSLISVALALPARGKYPRILNDAVTQANGQVFAKLKIQRHQVQSTLM